MEKARFYGIDLLRIWMCFEVYFLHIVTAMDKHATALADWFARWTSLAVPVFMIVAFYFSASRLRHPKPGWIKARLFRLALPFYFWPLVYVGMVFVLNRWVSPVMDVSFRDLGLQWLMGHQLIPALWFLFDLALLTTVFYALFSVIPARFHVWVWICAILLGVVMQYSGWNYRLFGDLPFAFAYPLGRLAEMLPCAGVGGLLFMLKPEQLSKGKRLICGAAALILFAVLDEAGFFPSALGFDYQGLKRLIMSTLLFTGFLVLPLEGLPKPVLAGLRLGGRLSLGPYCMRTTLNVLVTGYLFPKAAAGMNSFGLCCLLFGMAYGISYALSRFPLKWLRGVVL